MTYLEQPTAHVQCAPDQFSCRRRHFEAAHAALAAHQTQSLLARVSLPGLLRKQAEIIVAPVSAQPESSHHHMVREMFNAFVGAKGGAE